MRERLNESRLRAFMRGLAREASVEGRVYMALFESIRPDLYRYPAISAERFEERVRKLQ